MNINLNIKISNREFYCNHSKEIAETRGNRYMATINLYKIESSKINICIQDLLSHMTKKNTLIVTRNVEGKKYNFGVTLYLELPQETEANISWSWLLSEFNESPICAHKAPKAVVLIEKLFDEENYAVTFGSSFFRIDKYCDRDFGFKFASRIEFRDVKTTTLTAPNLKRSKTVNTYINYNELDFNSGESFAKLKVNAKLHEDFTMFKPAIEIGNSIRFSTEVESIERIIDILIFVENILQIPEENILNKIPLFQLIKDDELLNALNSELKEVLTSTILEGEDISQIAIPELEVVGASEIFNRNDDEFKLKYSRCEKSISSLSIDEIRTFCLENKLNTAEKVSNVKLVKFSNGESVVTMPLTSIIEYTNDEHKCILAVGKWYLFNKDYLTYLNDSIREVDASYNRQYDFNDDVHNQFIEAVFSNEKNDLKYAGLDDFKIKESLKKKYYAERCFNLLREQEGAFINYDRVDTSSGFEKMDLFEKSTLTMFAVKKGKSSSALCYAVDQSLTALKKYKHGEIQKMPQINNVGLWFILERAEHLPINEVHKVNLSELDMLMLKNRIDQWKKEVRLSGFKPVIYINYRG